MSEPISIDEVNRLQEENKELREQLDRAESGEKNEMDIANEYKKALEEIREMCNKHLDAKEICYATQVIDKINEVLK